MTAITGFRLYQSGLEGTRGTAVAATSKMAIEGLEVTALDEIARPKLAKGLITRNPGDETAIARGTSFRIPETPVVYDQIHQLLGMSVAGGVTASGADPYTWTHTRDITADPDPDTRTLERRISDGSNHVDHEWAYAFLSMIRFIYATDQQLRFAAEGFARRRQGSTLTAAQAMPTTEIPAAALAKIWIDATWAALGTTQITGQVIGADITFRTGLKPKMTLDGRTDLDFTTHILEAAEVGIDATIRMLVKANSGQYATELAAAEAETLRAVRLKVEGTQSRALTLDMLLKHEPGSIQTIASEDGQDIVEMRLVDATDGTNLFEAEVVNKTDSLD